MPYPDYTVIHDVSVGYPLPPGPIQKNTVNIIGGISYFKLVIGMARGGVLGDFQSFINTLPIIKAMADHALDSSSKNLCEKSNRPISKLAVDHASTAFAGYFGYGMATACAEKSGAIWFAHFEEVKIRATLHPPGGGGSTYPKKSPDLLSLDRAGILGWLECKGSFAADPYMWTKRVENPYRKQVEPWILGTLNSIPIPNGRVIFSQVNTKRVAVSQISSVSAAPSPTFPSSIILPHYARWLRLFGSAMWPLQVHLGRTQKNGYKKKTTKIFGVIKFRGQDYITSLPQFPYCETVLFEDSPIYFGINRSLLENLINESIESDELSTKFEILNLIEEYTENYSEEALDSVYSNFCSFPDGTIAFTLKENNELPNIQEISYEIYENIS